MFDLQDTIQEIKATSHSPSFTLQLNSLLESYPFQESKETRHQLYMLILNRVSNRLEEELDLWERKVVSIFLENIKDYHYGYFFSN